MLQQKITKILMILMLVLVGCSPTWWQDFKNNPVQQADLVINSATSAEQVAVVAFNQLKPLLPSDQQFVFQSKFDESVVVFNKSVVALRQVVKAAADNQEDKPNLTLFVSDVISSIEKIKDVVDSVRTLVSAHPAISVTKDGQVHSSVPATVIGYDELEGMVRNLNKIPH